VFKLNHAAVLNDRNLAGVHAHIQTQAGMLVEHAQLPVNRYQVARAGKVQHQLNFFLAGVPGNMHRRDSFVDDLRALFQQAVDGAVDQLLIARDGMRGQHHGIALFDVKTLVAAVGKSAEDRGRFSLRAGDQQHYLAVRHLQGCFDRYHHVFLKINVTQLLRNFHVFSHA